jgi:hypothetical protein
METHILCSENRAVYEIMSKTVVETEGPQMTSQYGAYALRAGLAKLHARTHKQTNKYYLLLLHGNTDSRTRLDVTLHVHCLSCIILKEVKLALYTPCGKSFVSN